MAGVPILTNVVPGARLLVEIAFGADLKADPATWPWTDVTVDVMFNDGQAVIIDPMGRQDELSTAAPAGCTFQLKNPNGRYTAFNPLGVNWPNVKRNTPVRVRASVDSGANWGVRFWGRANGFTPGWDDSRQRAIVTVSASGRTRQVAQGKKPLASAMRRAYLRSNPAAYWSLEGPGDVISTPSSLSGGSPALLSGAGLVKFAGIDGPAGSDKLMDFSSSYVAGTILTGKVPPNPAATSWRVEFSMVYRTTDASYQVVMPGWSTTGGVQLWYMDQNPSGSNGLRLNYLTSAGGFGSIASTFERNDGLWHHYRIDASQSGGNIAVTIKVDGATVQTGTVAGQAFGSVYKVDWQAGLSSTSPQETGLGHGAVWQPFASTVDTYAAFTGHAGETPAARMTRLCAEEGIPFEVVGFYSTSTKMGPQGIDTFMALLRECEITDAGFLYDGLSPGLQYQGISQRYDQQTALTLDASAKDLKYPFLPVDDDQRNRNLVRVTTKTGATATAEDVNGPLGTATIDTYDHDVSPAPNPVDASRLASRAGWEVHAGTIEGFRYPSISLSMLTNPSLLGRWLNRADGFTGPVVPGSRIDVLNVVNVLTQHPVGTVPLMLEGYREVISDEDLQVVGNCSPNRLYEVFKLGDSQLGRVQTSGSTLAANAAAGASSLTVTAAIPWVRSSVKPAVFPLYIEVSGIKVKVTAIAGATSPQTFTVDPATVTKGLHTGDAVKVWHTGVIKF